MGLVVGFGGVCILFSALSIGLNRGVYDWAWKSFSWCRYQLGTILLIRNSEMFRFHGWELQG